jgi:hypothetical protein
MKIYEYNIEAALIGGIRNIRVTDKTLLGMVRLLEIAK